MSTPATDAAHTTIVAEEEDTMTEKNPVHNTQGHSDGDVEADTASGGAPEERIELPDTTDENDRPVDNPSG